MGEEKSGAILAAESDYFNYANKEREYIAEKYVENVNMLTSIIEKHNNGQELNERDYYNFEYCQFMEQRLSYLLTECLLQDLGYNKDKNGIWGKKKKGFFTNF